MTKIYWNNFICQKPLWTFCYINFHFYKTCSIFFISHCLYFLRRENWVWQFGRSSIKRKYEAQIKKFKPLQNKMFVTRNKWMFEPRSHPMHKSSNNSSLSSELKQKMVFNEYSYYSIFLPQFLSLFLSRYPSIYLSHFLCFFSFGELN